MAIYSRSFIQNVKNWWFRIRKKKSLLNLIKEQDSGSLIDKIYLHAKVLSEPKYHFFIKKREDSTHYLLMKIIIKESYNILLLIIQQAFIIKILWRFIWNVQLNYFLFLTIDTTLPAKYSLRFTKKSFRCFMKMTLTDQLKILDAKIKANQAQYYLDKRATKTR